MEPTSCTKPRSKLKKIIQKLDFVLGQLGTKKKQILEIKKSNLDSINYLKKNLVLSLIKTLIPKNNQPDNWTMESLSSVCNIERGKFGHRPRNDPAFYGGKYPFIQTGNITKSNGRIQEYSQTLNEKGFKVSKMFPKGTVVISIAANIGDTAILEFDSCFPDSIIGITPMKEKAVAEYIEYVLRLYKHELDRNASKGAQKNINYGFLKPLKIPMPPTIQFQKDVAKRIQNGEKNLQKSLIHIESIKERIQELSNYLDYLQGSILSSAFSGKLVK